MARPRVYVNRRGKPVKEETGVHISKGRHRFYVILPDGRRQEFRTWEEARAAHCTGLANATGRFMPAGGVTQVTGGVPHLVLEGARLAETRFDDGHRVTANIGSYHPNAWGLYDMHGNAAEWTLSEYDPSGRKVVRGGSFFDRPERCRSSFRWRYPPWQCVFNVGLRIVVLEDDIDKRFGKLTPNRE